MSKPLTAFFSALRSTYGDNLPKRLSGPFTAGSRVLPLPSQSKDERNFQFRIDAGKLVDERFQLLNLRVNTRTKIQCLRRWASRNGTNAKLATVEFDTQAEDLEGESDRVLKEMEEAAKKKLG